MKRIFIIGVIGFVAVVILMMGALLAVLVTPVRAQVGEVLGRAVGQAQSIVAGVTNVQAQAQATPAVQLKDEKGILVAGVFVGSPADQAGLVRGDIILDVDGQAVNTYNDLSGVLSQHKVGDALKLTVQHGDAQKTVTVTLAESPVTTQAAPQATPQGTPQSGQPNTLPKRQKGLFQNGPYLGIVPIGAGQFNFKEGKLNNQPGARIMQVAAGSPAEKAGLKVGEVITAVDGTAVDQQNSLAALITKHKPGDSVKLSVQGTDGTARDVTVTLADNPQQAGTAYLGVSTGGFGRGHGFGFGLPGQNTPGNPDDQDRGINPHNFPGLAQHPGAFLEQVTQNSPAEKAGLKAGQVIEAVDGKKLDSAQALSSAISGHKPNDKVTLTVYDPQANKSSDVQVILGDNPQKAGTAWLGIQYGYFNFQNMPGPQKTPGAGSGGPQF